MGVTLMFPGQGSQYVGMGKQLEGKDSFKLFNQADEILGHSLSELIFSGPEDELKLTQNAQPAIVAYSCVLLKELQEILIKKHITIDAVMGHSVGEYSALVAAGVLTPQQAIKAVHMRGRFMQEAVPAGLGKMVAIMNVAFEDIEKACKESSISGSEVMPANFNDPTQVVISGHADACDRACEWLKKNLQSRFRAIALKVSAPFHSSLMNPAAKRLQSTFLEIEFHPNHISYIANIDAQVYAPGTSSLIIQKNLINQVAGPVLWAQSVSKLDDNCLCLEVGPGKVLAGLVKKINPNIRVISLDSEDALQEIEEAIK